MMILFWAAESPLLDWGLCPLRPGEVWAAVGDEVVVTTVGMVVPWIVVTVVIVLTVGVTEEVSDEEVVLS